MKNNQRGAPVVGAPGQVVPSAALRWVFRDPPAIPPGATVALEGTEFDKEGARAAGATPGKARWILEMHVYELDALGRPTAQAWLPVPMLSAEQALEQDRAAGISAAGLVVVGGAL